MIGPCPAGLIDEAGRGPCVFARRGSTEYAEISNVSERAAEIAEVAACLDKAAELRTSAVDLETGGVRTAPLPVSPLAPSRSSPLAHRVNKTLTRLSVLTAMRGWRASSDRGTERTSTGGERTSARASASCRGASRASASGGGGLITGGIVADAASESADTHARTRFATSDGSPAARGRSSQQSVQPPGVAPPRENNGPPPLGDRRRQRLGENGKERHYFLSHKKTHSTHGHVPGHIAQWLHDSLQSLGFSGWFDIDALTEISDEALSDGIAQCCTMIVLINDETHLSDWCQFEWAVAERLGIPIKVVIDLNHCSKRDVIDQIAKLNYPCLFRWQWTELTQRSRRDAVAELTIFVSHFVAPPDEIGYDEINAEVDLSDSISEPEYRRSAWSDTSSRPSLSENSHSTRFGPVDDEQSDTAGDAAEPASHAAPPTPRHRKAKGDAYLFDAGVHKDGTPLWHPQLNVLLLLGGFSTRPRRTRMLSATVWCYTVACFRYLCLAVCTTRLIYASGPAYTDFASCLATVVLHFHLLYAPYRLRAVLKSSAVRRIMAGVASNDTSAELCHQVHDDSKVLVRTGQVLAGTCLLLYFIAWLPLYFSEAYLKAPPAAWYDQLFGIASGVLFAIGIATLIPLLVCVHILSALITCISTIGAEASLDYLHPTVAQLGLRRFLAQGMRLAQCRGQGLTLSDNMIRSFQVRWNHGMRLYEQVQAELAPLHNVLLVWIAATLVVPLSLRLHSRDEAFAIDNRYGPPVCWVNGMRVVWVWVQGSVFLLFEAAWATRCTMRLIGVVHDAQLLILSQPAQRLLIHSIMLSPPRLKFKLTSLRVAATPTLLSVIGLVVALSALPWFRVRFECLQE